MAEQLTKWDALAGRTIELAIPLDSFHVTRVGLLFDDGDYAIIGVDFGYDHDYDVVLKEDLYDDERVAFGMMSQEDLDRKQQADREEHQKRIDDAQRREYEQLKKKFEGPVAT